MRISPGNTNAELMILLGINADYSRRAEERRPIIFDEGMDASLASIDVRNAYRRNSTCHRIC
jgi:hypothetical protein